MPPVVPEEARGAIEQIVYQAMLGNPFAWAILLAAGIYILDKAWWHTRGKKQNGNGCGQLKEIAGILKAATENQKESVAILRELKTGQTIILDRLGRD